MVGAEGAIGTGPSSASVVDAEEYCTAASRSACSACCICSARLRTLTWACSKAAITAGRVSAPKLEST